MKKAVLGVLLVLTVLDFVAILVASLAIWNTTDSAALERFKAMVSTALMPSFTAMLTFLAAVGVFKGILTLGDNSQRLANKGQPEKIEFFS